MAVVAASDGAGQLWPAPPPSASETNDLVPPPRVRPRACLPLPSFLSRPPTLARGRADRPPLTRISLLRFAVVVHVQGLDDLACGAHAAAVAAQRAGDRCWLHRVSAPLPKPLIPPSVCLLSDTGVATSRRAGLSPPVLSGSGRGGAVPALLLGAVWGAPTRPRASPRSSAHTPVTPVLLRQGCPPGQEPPAGEGAAAGDSSPALLALMSRSPGWTRSPGRGQSGSRDGERRTCKPHSCIADGGLGAPEQGRALPQKPEGLARLLLQLWGDAAGEARPAATSRAAGPGPAQLRGCVSPGP